MKSVFNTSSGDEDSGDGRQYEISIRLCREVLETFKQTCFDITITIKLLAIVKPVRLVRGKQKDKPIRSNH